MDRLIQYIREKLIVVYMFILGFLILISTLLTWYNKSELVETAKLKAEAEQVKYLLGGIFERTLRSIDLGIRGYALTQNAQLLSPYDGAVREHPANLAKIDSLLMVQKLDTSVGDFVAVKAKLNDYLEVAAKMKNEITSGNQEEFLRLLNQDKGYDAWVAFSPFYSKILAYENNVIATAERDYGNAMNRNLIVQTILLIAGTLILVVISRRLSKQARQRTEIFNTLKENSRQFLFNSGQVETKIDQSLIINETISHFKKASAFISSISNRDYNVKWEGLTQDNESLNKETLAGQLHNMKDQLIKIRLEEDQRNWSNVGLTQYSEVVRKFQDNTSSLCFESVKYITKYLKAQQGGLFVITEEGDEKFLLLTGCYAFDKKKFIEKRVAIGFGLIGQTYLEGETVKLKELPPGYTHITSGLGDATPRCLVIVPMKHNEQVIAILELASFQEFTPEQVQFIERCGEFLAAALSNSQTNDQIKKLLQDTQIQAESMRAQEEEMRQNMEELSATQEEMTRKERGYIEKIERLEKQAEYVSKN
jgi:putative methionine-R-sulfoxide reductase with GAF domain/preprotein translocase subunit SecG